MKRAKKRSQGPGSRPGTPHQQPDGRWEQWITFEGKRYSRSGASKQEVRDKITALRAELRSPERQKARELGPTLAELADQLLTNYDDEGSTHRIYTTSLGHWRRLLGDATRQATITGSAVQAAVDELASTLTPATLTNYYASLRLALGADHPALKKIMLPKETDDDDDDEPRMLVSSALALRLQMVAQHHPLGIAIGLGLGAGTRAGEAAALRWRDIDWERNQLSINGSIKPSPTGWIRGKPKGGKARSFTVNPELIAWLASHRRIQSDTADHAGYPAPEYVLANPTTGQGVNRAVPIMVLRALLAEVCTPEEHAIVGDLRYHALRHTHISGLLSRGAGVADVARRAGHTPATLLRYYAHAMPGADAQLAMLAGELFPILKPEASSVAMLTLPRASEGRAMLTERRLEPSRRKPQEAAGSAENPDDPDQHSRSEPQETAAVSNPISSPPARRGGAA